jgi:type I restriction enzyme S subunit
MKEKMGLPNGWDLVRLETVIKTFIVPQRDRPKTFDGNIPWCRIEDIDGIYLSKSKIGLRVSEEVIESMPLRVYPKGTVIVSCSADLGRCAIIAKPLITNQTFIGLVPSEKIDSLYLYYLMGSKSKMLNNMATGATIKYLSKSKFQELEIPLPPLPEQQRIVSILDEAFAAIAKAKANAEQNLLNAKELFESYLQGVFDPSARSGQGKGDDWEEKKLGEVVEIINGRNQSQVISENGKYPIYGSAANLMGYATDYLCEKGTTIIGRKGNISNPIYIEERFWNVDTAFGLFPKNGYDTKFIHYLCRTIDFKSRNRGTTIPSLVKSDLLAIDVPFISSLKEQQTIVRQLDALRAETQKLEAVYQKKIDDLEELKKSILQMAFAGELKMKKAIVI